MMLSGMRIYSSVAMLIIAGLIAACSSSTPGPNRPPQAVAGPDQSISLGSVSLLDGQASFDPDGDVLSYNWALVAAPPGVDLSSVLEVPPADALSLSQARLTPNLPGTWLMTLSVSDPQGENDRDVVQIRVVGDYCEIDDDCDNDGLYCNGEEHCINYNCQFQATECDDQDQCTQNICNEDLDQCEFPNETDGTGCDDGLYCTVDDQCSSAVCSGTARDCSAAGGSCVDGTCNEDNDVCDGTTLPDNTVCDDQDQCTSDDKCLTGQCQGTAKDCSHLDSDCTLGACENISGDCYTEPANETQACEDGLYCTENSTCQTGECLGSEVDCSAFTDECKLGFCDEDGDVCATNPINENQICDDGLYCTLESRCQSGECSPSVTRECPSSSGDCQVGFCNPVGDLCDLEPAEDGDACSTGDPCLVGETCLAGSCQGGQGCPLGCNATASRCYEIDPSNVDAQYFCPADAVEFSPPGNSIIWFDTDDGTIDGSLVPNFIIQSQGATFREIGVFYFTSMDIPETTTLEVVGNRAAVFLVCRDINLYGLIDGRASGQWRGPGGWSGGKGRTSGSDAAAGSGPGGGGAGDSEYDWPYCHTSGGGGGHARPGGKGGDGTPTGPHSDRPGGPAGIEYGELTLIPLSGGSGGGGGGSISEGGYGGGGGGAIQITAGGTIYIGPNGGIDVRGSGGEISDEYYYGGGGGGGSGGGVLLEAVSIDIDGTLAANGGGGAGGRAAYWDWDEWCPMNRPTAGENGPFEYRRANGGLNCTDNDSDRWAGDGGRGGAMINSDTTGEAGDDAWIGGGGGGGVGYIRLNTYNSQLDISDATLSPGCSGSNQRCTSGDIGLY
jgi:K319-like protein